MASNAVSAAFGAAGRCQGLQDIGVFGILAGIVITFGLTGAAYPQHKKVWRAQGVSGLSPMLFGLNILRAQCLFVNLFLLKGAQFRACSELGVAACWPSLLTFGPVVFNPTHHCLMLYWFLRFGTEHQGQRVRRGIAMLVVYQLAIFAFLAAVYSRGLQCSDTMNAVGDAFGFASGLLMVLKDIPQAYRTYHTKGAGQLSYITMSFIALGSYVMAANFALIQRENLSSWLGHVISGFVQTATLIYAAVHDRRAAASVAPSGSGAVAVAARPVKQDSRMDGGDEEPPIDTDLAAQA